MTSESANQLVEHFFRHESAKLVAVMTRAFGIRRLELVEDMVQVALLEAMQTWTHHGIPENPAGWIHRAARNRILDALRREEAHKRAVAVSGQSIETQESLLDEWLEDKQPADSLLRMIFVCCHPSLERKTQIALTLKTLCGFGVSEIARGLLLPAETVKKRIQRAKQSLAAANVQLELPSQEQLVERLEVVHEVLYLMFNEGYSTSNGNEPIREDICEEAARLCHLLCQSMSSTPVTKALLALMLFQSARLDARTDQTGATILLEDQDRDLWNLRVIEEAHHWLSMSRTDRPTTFHFEAAISMQHCLASSVEQTDWNTIIQLYDRLLELSASPIYILNRAIALGQVGETDVALSQLETLSDREELKSYLLLNCAIARINELAGNKQEAIDCYRAALSKQVAPHEQEVLTRKLRHLMD